MAHTPERPDSLTQAGSHGIRQACAADAAALAAIDAASQVNPWCEAQFTALTSGAAAQTVLVSDDNGRAVGYVVFDQVLDEASILRIAVHPEFRGRRLGRGLLEAAMTRMRHGGARRCLLEVRRSNAVAQRLYASCGFQVDGVRKNYYPTRSGREDALLMSMSL